MDDRCDKCQYWCDTWGEKPKQSWAGGQCRRNPPHPRGVCIEAEWPNVKAGSWCGKYKKPYDPGDFTGPR